LVIASIDSAIKVGGNKWDAYISLAIGNKRYKIYIPMLPKKPISVSVDVKEQSGKIFLRLISSDGGICTCELDIHTLDISKCYNISCTAGATWIANEEILRSHIK
jgi:hypothetical protein